MPTADEIRAFRFDHVGSYLRPKHLLQARKDVTSSLVSTKELRQIEDDVIRNIVKKEEEVGLRSVTDGEQRREYFHLDFLEKLEGITITHNNLTQEKEHSPPVLSVTGKIRHVRPIQLDDFLFLKSCARTAIPKVTIPSPTMAHFRAGRAGISEEAYPNLADFFEDLAKAYRTEIQTLYDAGARYIQLDDTNLAYLCSPVMRKAAQERGEDLDTLPQRYASLINSVIDGRPNDLIIGLHLCKGNFRSMFFAEGGYEPIAPTLFRDIHVDVLYLEWESERSGSLEPLRYLAPGRTVILGLLSSKVGALEDKAKIIKRIHEAASYCGQGLNQLGLSTQCGFSSTYHGNDITEEEQWAKLRLAREIVDEVWGKGA